MPSPIPRNQWGNVDTRAMRSRDSDTEHSDPPSNDSYNDQLIPMPEFEGAYPSGNASNVLDYIDSEGEDEPSPDVIPPGFQERLEDAIAEPDRLEVLARDATQLRHQPYRSTILMCHILEEIIKYNLEDSFEIFFPLFVRQWFKYEMVLQRRRRNSSEEEPLTGADIYKCSRTIARGCENALRDEYYTILKALLSVCMADGYGSFTDTGAALSRGETQRDLIELLLPQAVKHDPSVVEKMLERSIHIKALKKATLRAVALNKPEWVRLLVDNLKRDKPDDEKRKATELSLEVQHPKVKEAINKEKAQVLQNPFFIAFRANWSEIANTLFPAYLKLVTSFRWSLRDRFDGYIMNVPWEMYLNVPRADCFEALKTDNLPRTMIRRILRRLRQKEPGVFVVWLELKTEKRKYKISRDVLCYHSRFFASLGEADWGEDPLLFKIPEVSELVMEDVIRFLHSGTFVPSPQAMIPLASLEAQQQHIESARRVAVRYQMQELIDQISEGNLVQWR
ncbi:hypothetical protein BJY04DRAFT_217367 [Aspergillus karnatakaensis]|uniref:BTB/POZ domain-containing protein n=1 Tax=Aspergillus karnatakaensis TaxID=1810916 RepID=UPI003CCD1ECB